MGTIVDGLLPVLADIRHNIIDKVVGLRRYRVFIRREAPSDGRGGIGAAMTRTDVELTEKPKVRPMSEKDVTTAAGGALMGDWLMDRITPPNDAGTVGTPLTTLVPTPNPLVPGEKVFVVLVGPGMPAYIGPGNGGGEFTPYVLDGSKNFQYRIGLHPRTGHR